MNQFPLTGTVQGRLPSFPRQQDARLPEKIPWEGPRSRGPQLGEPKEKTLCKVADRAGRYWQGGSAL